MRTISFFKMLCLHAVTWLSVEHAIAQNVVFGSSNGTITTMDLLSIHSIVYHNSNLVVGNENCGDRYFSVYSTEYLTLDGSVNVLDSESNQGFFVFPNPATEELILNTTSTECRVYTIMNAAGKTLYSGAITSEKTRINIAHLATGIYFIQSGTIHKTFVKL